MRRKQPAPDPNMVAIVIALVLIPIFFVLFYLAIAGPNPTISLLGPDAPTPSPTPPTADAERVVQKMYDAMTSGAEAAYKDAIAPASREQIRLGNVAHNFVEHSKFEVYGYELPLDFLTDVDYLDMRYSGTLVASDYVTVTARGSIFIKALSVQYPVCDTWDVHPYRGQWLVDVDAPERSARQQHIADVRLRDDPGLRRLPFGLGQWWEQWGSGPIEGVKKILNMCE